MSELLSPDLLADPHVQVEYLADLLRDPTPLAELPPPPPFRPVDEHGDPVPRHRPDPEEPVEQESALARSARLAGLAVAAAALCAAVVAASHAAEEVRGKPRPERAAVSLTGAHALAGFDRSELPREVATTGSDAPATSDAPTPSETAVAQERIAPPADEPATSTATSTPEDALETVRSFYQAVAADPLDALDMVSPDLLTTEQDDLVASWERVNRVTLHDLRVEPDGMVRVVLTMIGDGEEQVRMTQLLRLDAPTGLISEAKLLSAHRTSGTSASTGG